MVMILLVKRCSVQCNKLVVKELCIGGCYNNWPLRDETCRASFIVIPNTSPAATPIISYR